MSAAIPPVRTAPRTLAIAAYSSSLVKGADISGASTLGRHQVCRDDRVIQLTQTLAMSESERDVARDALRGRIARRCEIGEFLDVLGDL
jgi:hypothetical protein